MKIKIKDSIIMPDAFVSRAFYLAYQASQVMGMGHFQARNNVSEQDVFNNVLNAGDYAYNPRDGRVYADYVFGRMMKLGINVKEGIIESKSSNYRSDYQSFAGTYPNIMALFDATAKSYGIEYELVEL